MKKTNAFLVLLILATVLYSRPPDPVFLLLIGLQCWLFWDGWLADTLAYWLPYWGLSAKGWPPPEKLVPPGLIVHLAPRLKGFGSFEKMYLGTMCFGNTYSIMHPKVLEYGQQQLMGYLVRGGWIDPRIVALAVPILGTQKNLPAALAKAAIDNALACQSKCEEMGRGGVNVTFSMEERQEEEIPGVGTPRRYPDPFDTSQPRAAQKDEDCDHP